MTEEELALVMTGEPYGKIRTLRREIQDYKYELSLFDMNLKKRGRKKWERYISEHKAEIKKILDALKIKKSSGK